jgi:predicted PurR-regulated permease PerM
MALGFTIVLVIALVAVRLLIPPVPWLLKMGIDRWGKRSTMMLCAISLAGAAVVILISRR